VRTVQSFDFDKEPGLLLPLGVRRFSGMVDFSNISPGAYVIKVEAERDEGRTEQSLVVRVSENKEEGKVVDVVKPDDEPQKETEK